jgi:hypothetical protein
LANNCPYFFFVAISDQKWDVIVSGVGLQSPHFKALAVAVGAAYQLVGGIGNPKSMLRECVDDLALAIELAAQ